MTAEVSGSLRSILTGRPCTHSTEEPEVVSEVQDKQETR